MAMACPPIGHQNMGWDHENHRGLIAAPAAMLDLATDSHVATSNDVVYISQQMAITPLTLSHGLNAEQIFQIHDLVVASANQRILAEVAQNIVNRDEFTDFTSYSLILLDRANHLQFHSSLVRRGEDIRERMQ